MGKKSTPIEKAARMLDLVPYISSHQGISTEDLAAQFGISITELMSDLNSLWMCGDNRFDLMDLEFHSGYVTIRNAKTLNVIRSLSQQEIVSLLIGLGLIEKSIPTERSDLHQDLRSLREKIGEQIVNIVDATPSFDGAIYATIEAALVRQLRLRLTYFSPSADQITYREVTPIQFTRSNDRDFLVAYCENSQGQRSFRLDRIQGATLIDLPAAAVETVKEQNVSVVATVRILADLRKSREALGDFVSGDGDVVEVSTYSQSWLSRTVMAGAGAMEVIEAPEVREYIAASAQRTLDLYR